MAEKARFKKNREFKKRLDEQEENEEADIRSFTFHSLERRNEKMRGGDRRERRDRRDDYKNDFNDSKNFRDSKKQKDFRNTKDSKSFKKGKFTKDRRDNFDMRKQLFGDED